MCGIAGFFTSGSLHGGSSTSVLLGMAAAIEHRGPDDSGTWSDEERGIGLAHRRLSILDLSPLGHQPMLSRSGRYVVVFNGEIYNFAELRGELRSLGHDFRGGSDTEVLLAACEEWGPEQALRRAVGMFAIALWDQHERCLMLSRDRFGEKPLYFAELDQLVLFGSELKALRAHPQWRGSVDRDSLAALLRYNYIPAPGSIFRDVRKVLPGHSVIIRRRAERLVVENRCYWNAREVAEEALHEPVAAAEQAVAETERLIGAAIRRQMVADVPLGAFLSGGIDSSLVVALMQSLSERPVKTFTIGFWDPKFNEAEHARKIAHHLGTEHTELMVTPRDALNVIPQLPFIYDEPFGDSSQIPTYLVSRLARQHVTVSLSGDAGDELFCGYDRYGKAMSQWDTLSRVPWRVRSAGAALVGALPAAAVDAAMGAVSFLHPRLKGKQYLAERLRSRAQAWRCRSPEEIYHRSLMFWTNPHEVVAQARAAGTLAQQGHRWPAAANPMQRAMLIDLGLYLPDDILVKVDRAAMAVSLETRVPLLDPEVMRFAWRIPLAVHRRDGRGKWVLRQILARHVPQSLFDRPKMGFAVPLGDWLRGELRPWAESLLEPARLRSEGYFDAALVSHCWRQHVEGSFDWSLRLWGVLMFQAWMAAAGAQPLKMPVSRVPAAALA